MTDEEKRQRFEILEQRATRKAEAGTKLCAGDKVLR